MISPILIAALLIALGCAGIGLCIVRSLIEGGGAPFVTYFAAGFGMALGIGITTLRSNGVI